MLTPQDVFRRAPELPPHMFDFTAHRQRVHPVEGDQDETGEQEGDIFVYPTLVSDSDPLVGVQFPVENEVRLELMMTDLTGELLLFTTETHEGPLTELFLTLDDVIPGPGLYLLAVSINGRTRMELLQVVHSESRLRS